MTREERRKEHAEIARAALGNLAGAGDFTGIDYSGVSSDTIMRAARCAQLLFSKEDAWLKDPGATAGLIACYMQGAIDAAATGEGAQ